MVGSAVAMMVWFSAERNAASIRPKKMVRTSAWLIWAWLIWAWLIWAWLIWAWLIALRGAPATSAGVAVPVLAAPPGLPDGAPEGCFRRCRTLIRTLARA